MSIVLRVSSGGVPPGSYLAKFVGIEETHNQEYGAGIRWIFEIVTGPHKGGRPPRTTSPNPSLKNGCGKMLSGITGKPLIPGEDHDLEPFIGKTYLIVVVATESGSTKIDSVSPPPVA
jgi:hypothetical protein